MTQRTVFPAVVIGTVFALLLTLCWIEYPPEGSLVAFALNALFMLAALAVYGGMMQIAARADAPGATAGAPAASAGARENRRPRQERPQRPQRGQERAQDDTERNGSRRGAPRNGESRPPREESGAELPAEALTEGPRESGAIKWFSGTKGFGFIVREDGSEVFVHHRAMRNHGRRDLPDGQPVSFVVVEREKGLQADAVEVQQASGGSA